MFGLLYKLWLSVTKVSQSVTKKCDTLKSKKRRILRSYFHCRSVQRSFKNYHNLSKKKFVTKLFVQIVTGFAKQCLIYIKNY